MPKNPRRIAKLLMAAGFGADVHFVDVSSTITGTATRTTVLFRARKKLRLRSASYAGESATDGTKTLTIQNNTRSLAMTAALTISGLAALAGADFVLSGTDTNLIVNKGDFVTLIYTVTVAGTTGPTEAAIHMEFQILAD